MPTFTHGKNATVLANGYNLSPYFNSVTASGSSDTAEVSTFGNASKAYIPGMRDATFSVEGYYDASAGAVDETLSAILGTETVWTTVMSADAIGARGYAANTISTTVETGAEIGGAVTVSAEGQSTNGLDAIVVLHALGAETASGTGTQVDNGAATTGGAAGYLHVTAVSGTPSITAKVQHSSDGTTWADLITFTAVTTANASERIAVTGTVNRYTRALWTISGGSPSATFHLSAARL
jgi:hypothetical protein